MKKDLDNKVESKEADLVGRAREGDVEAFGGLVELFQDRVFNFAYRLTSSKDRAWDLSQEAFLKAFAAIGRFKGASGFYTWIYRIVLNLHINRENRLSRKMEKQSLSMDLSRGEGKGSRLHEQLPDGNPGGDPASELLRKERQTVVQEAIAALPADQRQVVLLRDLEGLAYEEIAALLSIPIGTVRSRLHRARDELKRHLQGTIGFPEV